MTAAVRSPGSTLKPIIYGLAFEAGLAHPETLIEDRPTRFGVYVPKNFDQDWHGTVTVRMALAQSLNIPAVKVLEALGPPRLFSRLAPGRRRRRCCRKVPSRRWQSRSAVSASSSPISPRLYAGLARGGEPIALQYRRDVRRTQTGCRAPTAAVAGRRLVRRRHPAPRAGARQRQAGRARLQDRHLLRLPRRLGGGLRRPSHHRRVGRPARRRRHAGPGRPHRRRAAAVRRLRAPLAAPRAAACAPLRHAQRRRQRAAAAAEALPRGAATSWCRAPIWSRRCRSPSRPTAPSSMSRTATSIGIIVKAEGGALPLTWLVDGVPINSDPARREAELPAAEPRLPQALRHRRQRPRRPRHDPAEVAGLRLRRRGGLIA